MGTTHIGLVSSRPILNFLRFRREGCRRPFRVRSYVSEGIWLPCLLSMFVLMTTTAYASLEDEDGDGDGGDGDVTSGIPELIDPNLEVEPVADGLSYPTSMGFIDINNILVLEKNSGEVRLISNGIAKEEPVLRVEVDTESSPTCCRGLLGIATRPSLQPNGAIPDESQTQMNNAGWDSRNEVFLYFSEKLPSSDEVRNRIYKYFWNGERLINLQLILDLPANPGPNHPGGKLKFGIDGYLYTVIGDLNNEGQLQNFNDGSTPNDSSVILRINASDGSAALGNPFNLPDEMIGNVGEETEMGTNQMDKYFAYGIRNSFGLSVDPLTGNIWDTENGDVDYDEINLVSPGFNSGWKKLMGPISRSDITQDELVTFEGAHYSDPVLSWNPSLGITDIEFFNSMMLGPRYYGNIFVGDIVNGNLYFYTINSNRNGILPEGAGLEDLVADGESELSSNIMGTGFGGGITDIETGPDGLLYILTFDYEGDGEGKVYKIKPKVLS